MSYIKHRWPFFIAILLLWFLFNFNFKIETIIFGLIISVLMTIFVGNVLFDEHGFRFKKIKLHQLLIYVFILFIEIFKASFNYIKSIAKRDYKPFIFIIKLDVDDPIEVALIANSITLTPGTVTIDIDGSNITVLTIAKTGTPVEQLEKPIRQKFERLLKKGTKK
jgi:multicomponent Na+:H+ antiporter subunit E